MNGRLRTLTNIWDHLDDALGTLRSMHTSLAVQIEELKAYIANLSPETDTAAVQQDALPNAPQDALPSMGIEGARGGIKRRWMSKLPLFRSPV
ncbi:hypothetical protein TRAPUB_8485 [Trametes pubescens]|uniref:Uncharacterized protein n=1 Tax=Trametes pubescens TaxID=154538 RepID=A0A1M2W509_TRAPU|nr:hypothetical protein TRAPUB_8485 [Trametes pubescens]